MVFLKIELLNTRLSAQGRKEALPPPPLPFTTLGESAAFLVDSTFGSMATCIFFLCVFKTHDVMSFWEKWSCLAQRPKLLIMCWMINSLMKFAFISFCCCVSGSGCGCVSPASIKSSIFLFHFPHPTPMYCNYKLCISIPGDEIIFFSNSEVPACYWKLINLFSSILIDISSLWTT